MLIGELQEAVRSLHGTRIQAIGRAMDLGIMEFWSPVDDKIVYLHIQCPFRVIHDGDLVLGSDDISYRDSSLGADSTTNTVFDGRCNFLNHYFGESEIVVNSATLGVGGFLLIKLTSSFSIEVFPNCSGEVEMWRFFIREDVHYGFPPEKFEA